MRANGIKVNKGWVYISGGDKIYRVQMGTDRRPKGGLMLLVQGVSTDDFGIAPDGTIYAPSGKMMMKISPSGQPSVFLNDIETESSPAAWVDARRQVALLGLTLRSSKSDACGAEVIKHAGMLQRAVQPTPLRK